MSEVLKPIDMNMPRSSVIQHLRDEDFAGPMIHLMDWAELQVLMHRAADLLQEAEEDEIIRDAMNTRPAQPDVTGLVAALEALVQTWRKTAAEERAFVDGGCMSRGMAQEFMDRSNIHVARAQDLAQALAAFSSSKEP